jgi:hypothetical protein
VEDVEDEPLFAERVAGIDIGKAMVMATIRVLGSAGGSRRRQETPAVRDDLAAGVAGRLDCATRRPYFSPVIFRCSLSEFEYPNVLQLARGDYYPRGIT